MHRNLSICVLLVAYTLPAALAPVQAELVPATVVVESPAAERSTDDLFEFVLQSELRMEPRIDVERVRVVFDALVASCRGGLPTKAEPQTAVARLNRVLLSDHLLDYRSEDYWRDARMSTVLLERQGNCWGLSLLYAAIAERLDLPVQVVREPDHALVRWDDGATIFEIETTNQGARMLVVSDPRRRVLVLENSLRKEVLRLEIQRWLEAGSAAAASVALERLALEAVSEAEQALWQARIQALDRDVGEVLLLAAAGLVEVDAGPTGLRAEAHRILAEAALRRGASAEACDHFARMAELSGRTRQIYALLRIARIARQAGALDQALDAAERAIHLAPGQRDATCVLAEVLLAAGRPEAALPSLQRARRMLGEDPVLAAVEAACLLRSGQRESAEALLASLQLKGEQDAMLAFNLAWVRVVDGDQQASLAWLERAVAVAGNERVNRWLARAPDFAPLLEQSAWQSVLQSSVAVMLPVIAP